MGGTYSSFNNQSEETTGSSNLLKYGLQSNHVCIDLGINFKTIPIWALHNSVQATSDLESIFNSLIKIYHAKKSLPRKEPNIDFY